MKVLLAVLLATAPTPGPGQSLDPAQSQANGRAVLETGHVDIGPRLRDGKWTIQIHDDHAVPAVWREPADTVLRVRDTAGQRVPDDPAYAFLGEPPGTAVHVVPQTEKPGVIWIGWNTQDPGVLGAVGRGVTMSLRGVRGPGNVTVFLQSGNLGAPQVLWSSTKPMPQPIWVETNTHTHANWVFGRPGTYLLAVDISADLAGGSTATASTVLRLAVGDVTEPDFDGTVALPTAAGPETPTTSSGTWEKPALIGSAALALLIVVLLVARQSAARRRAERDHEAAR